MEYHNQLTNSLLTGWVGGTTSTVVSTIKLINSAGQEKTPPGYSSLANNQDYSQLLVDRKNLRVSTPEPYISIPLRSTSSYQSIPPILIKFIYLKIFFNNLLTTTNYLLNKYYTDGGRRLWLLGKISSGSRNTILRLLSAPE